MMFKQLAVPNIQDASPGQPSATTSYPSSSHGRAANYFPNTPEGRSQRSQANSP